MFLSDDLQGTQSETETKQDIQHLRKELVEAQELARTSKQKCFELQGEMKIPAAPWGPVEAAMGCDSTARRAQRPGRVILRPPFQMLRGGCYNVPYFKCLGSKVSDFIAFHVSNVFGC